MTDLPVLSVEDLMTKGYFPDRVIPPINALGLTTALPDIAQYGKCVMQKLLARKKPPCSRCVTHSAPKRKHLRRIFSIPNPLHHYLLSHAIAQDWKALESHCFKSEFTLTMPTLDSKRSLAAKYDLGKQPIIRAQRSPGARYLLKTDIARYYPSIYTHSIPWALHGKSAAKANRKLSLLGNTLDLLVREGQDQQTSSIPIGPDTSFLIGEVIATALDVELKERMPKVRGTRSIDDYHLYFDSISEAESGLALLHAVASQMELDLNDPKTEIIQMLTALEPSWKSDLRNLQIRTPSQPQATDLLSLFDRTFGYSKVFIYDNVLTYAARQILSADITEENWPFCEAMLLQAAVSEPSMLSVLAEIYKKYEDFTNTLSPLSNAIHSICSYHAPLQQGNEVSWALWIAKQVGVTVNHSIGDKVAALDDDIVALISLDLREQGLFESTQLGLWENNMNANSLQDEHWLLAYESQQHAWLTPSNENYVENNEFFSISNTHNVRFYEDQLVETSSFSDYSGDIDVEIYDSEDLDDEV